MKILKNKLSLKLILSLIGITIGAVVIVTIVGSIALKNVEKETVMTIMYISQAVFAVFIVITFFAIVYYFIIRRINTLNGAMEEVASGNYDVKVVDKSKDELSDLNDSFNKMTKELKANELLSKDFVRNISHELKTPISAIRSYAELTQNHSDDETLSSYMDIIVEETDRLDKLSTNILTLCKLDSTNILTKKEFSPAVQIRSVFTSMQLVWTTKNLDVDLSLEEFTINSDEGLVFHIWQNLIGNAIKFSEEGDRISVGLKKDGDYCIFEISDTGCGIREEDKEKIFTLFFTGDRSRNKEGNGIGLHLTKKIVEKLNGTITFEAKADKGTTFFVRLPVE